MSATHKGFLPALLVLAIVASPRAGRAEEAGAQAPESASREPAQRLSYVTDSGHDLPLLMYAPYQSARRRWLAGFIGTMSSIGLVATGVGLLIIGGEATSVSMDRRGDITTAGGIFTGIGIAGTALGAALWHWGRRDLLQLENNLPRHDSGIRAASLAPSVTLSPAAPGSLRLSLALSGTF